VNNNRLVIPVRDVETCGKVENDLAFRPQPAFLTFSRRTTVENFGESPRSFAQHTIAVVEHSVIHISTAPTTTTPNHPKNYF
jgi:hypothetical protein